MWLIARRVNRLEATVRDSVMWFLVSSVVITALFIVQVRHQHRIAYVEFHAQEVRRDAVNDEWGQLLIEENSYGFPHSVEMKADKLLSMRAPQKDDIEFVGLPELAPSVKNASARSNQLLSEQGSESASQEVQDGAL